MAKKPGAVRQATFSSSQICKEEQKPYCGKGTELSSFLGSMPKRYCFSCLIYKIILFGGRSDSCILGDKKAQNESSRALHATWLISLNAATAIECDKKTKGGCR